MAEPDQIHDAEDARQAWSREEIDAAIAGLDRATQRFSSRLGSIQRDAPHAMPHAPEPPSPRPLGERVPEVEPPARHETRQRIYRAPGREPEGGSFDDHMRNAEREARIYLDRAKQRADALVNSMIGAVEEEAAEIRRDAEEGIRERWRQVEEEAGRYLENARRVADGMVGERQRQIGSLSDGIVARAQALTAGMEDADRVRRQFDDFVRALSRTADQIARNPSVASAEPPGVRRRSASSPEDAVAA